MTVDKSLVNSHRVLNMFKLYESARESMRVHESWRLNKSGSLDSCHNSHRVLNMFKVDELRGLERRTDECVRVCGPTRVRVRTLLNSQRLSYSSADLV